MLYLTYDLQVEDKLCDIILVRNSHDVTSCLVHLDSKHRQCAHISANQPTNQSTTLPLHIVSPVPYLVPDRCVVLILLVSIVTFGLPLVQRTVGGG